MRFPIVLALVATLGCGRSSEVAPDMEAPLLPGTMVAGVCTGSVAAPTCAETVISTSLCGS